MARWGRLGMIAAALSLWGCSALEQPGAGAARARSCECSDVEAIAQRLQEVGGAIDFYQRELADLERAGAAPPYTPERGFTMRAALLDLTDVRARRSGVDPLPPEQACLEGFRGAAPRGFAGEPRSDWTMRDYAREELEAHRAERLAMRREIARLDARCSAPPTDAQKRGQPSLNPATLVLKTLLIAYSLWLIFL